MSFAETLRTATTLCDEASGDAWSVAYDQGRAMCEPEIERLNDFLRPLFPRLHEKLKARYNDELQDRIANGPFKGCKLEHGDLDYQIRSMLDDVLEDVSLDVDGYDGWMFGCDDLKLNSDLVGATNGLRDAISQVVTEHRDAAIRTLIQQVMNGEIEAKNHKGATRVIMGVLDNSGASYEAQMLWMFESGGIKESDWLVLAMDDLHVPSIWREIESELPPEVVELLNCGIEV